MSAVQSHGITRRYPVAQPACNPISRIDLGKLREMQSHADSKICNCLSCNLILHLADRVDQLPRCSPKKAYIRRHASAASDST